MVADASHSPRFPAVLRAAIDGGCCSVDEDCSLNGICNQGCLCNKGWTGQHCEFLDRGAPESKSAAAVYGMHPNVTSWRGNALRDNASGLHHLFVTEIAGPNNTHCGLISWGTHSTIVHAVSSTGMGGPYIKKGVAVQHEGHNPQTIRFNGEWVIFHIGDGSPLGTRLSPCPAPSPPPCPSYTSKATCTAPRCVWTAITDSCTAAPPPPAYCVLPKRWCLATNVAAILAPDRRQALATPAVLGGRCRT
jgi:hypothetical protein